MLAGWAYCLLKQQETSRLSTFQHSDCLFLCVWSSVSLLSVLFALASVFKETEHPNYKKTLFLTYRVVPGRADSFKFVPLKALQNCISNIQRAIPARVTPLLGTDPLKPQRSFTVLAGRCFSTSKRPVKFSMEKASSSLRHFSV